MKKRRFTVFCSVLLTVMLVLAMLPAVSSAAGASSKLDGALEFYVDLRKGSDEDIQGNYTKTTESDDAVYVDDETLGSKVGLFGDDCMVLTYDNPAGDPLAGYDLTDGITLEAYIYISPDATESNMTFVETAGSSLHLQMYNDGKDSMVGFRCGDTTEDGTTYTMNNAYTERGKILDFGKWIHLTGVSDGVTNRFYIDGLLVSSVDRNQTVLKGVNDNKDTKLTVGESVLGAMWGDTALQGRIAYVKMYKEAADDADVAALYESATGVPPAGGSAAAKPTKAPEEEPAEKPEEKPTEEPAAKATAKPTTAPSATAAAASEAEAGSAGSSSLVIVIIAGSAAILIAAAVLVVVLVRRNKETSAEAPKAQTEPPVQETQSPVAAETETAPEKDSAASETVADETAPETTPETTQADSETEKKDGE